MRSISGRDFPTTTSIRVSVSWLAQAMRQGYNQYAPMPGLPRLREAIAAKLERRYGITVDTELEITVTLGAQLRPGRSSVSALVVGR